MLKWAVDNVMPASIQWSLVCLDGTLDTDDRWAAVETTWRLGGLDAVNVLLDAWQPGSKDFDLE